MRRLSSVLISNDFRRLIVSGEVATKLSIGSSPSIKDYRMNNKGVKTEVIRSINEETTIISVSQLTFLSTLSLTIVSTILYY